MLLELNPDELLSTTRSVRLRLDLERPVDPGLIDECVTVALQAPTAGNAQREHFVIVTDAERKAALAELWRSVAEPYVARRREAAPPGDSRAARIGQGVVHLAEHLHEVPVLVIPCIEGRTDSAPIAGQASTWGSILPAAWSFMLAARARGLASAWTTFHLVHERAAAEILGIPYEKVMQAALLPVAHAKGTDFRPAPRRPLDEVLHRDRW